MKLKNFKKFEINSNHYIFGGAEKTGSGSRSYTNEDGCTVTYDYDSDCKGTDGAVAYCGRSNEITNCPT